MMDGLLLLFYPAVFIFMAFFRCKVSKKGEFCASFLDKENSKLLQGIFCLFIILHHLTQRATQYGAIFKGPITVLSSMGILFTSVFFFFSGYGLILSVRKKPTYLDDFLSHRLPIILVPFFTANLVFVLYRIFYAKLPTSNLDIIKCIFGLVLLNGNGWYIVEIFLLYLAFYLWFRIFRNQNISFVLLILTALLLIRIGFVSGHDYTGIGDYWFKGEWWYNSTIVFVMGMFFARFKDSIFSFLKKHYSLLLPLTIVLFLVAFTIEEIILACHGYYTESVSLNASYDRLVTLIAQSIACLIFMFLIILISMKVEIKNKPLSFFSKISTELFLIHNLFIHCIFEDSVIKDFYYYGLIIICSIPLAFILHYINAPIIKFFQSFSKIKTAIKKINFKIVIPVALVIVLIACSAYLLFYKFVKLPAEYKNELLDIKNSNIGDEVKFGRYETDYALPGKERLTWIVLDKKDDEIMLITKEGIASSAYLQKHDKTKWSSSDLCQKLNSIMFYQLFSKYEQECIIPNPDSGDMLSLLSETEAKTYFGTDSKRQLSITSVAEKSGANLNTFSKVNDWDYKDHRSSWWWLRGDETPSIKAPIVTVDGVVDPVGKYVNKPGGAIRPVAWLHISN